jgi:flagellar FliJ protein
MSKNLEKTYNPKEIEAKLYEKWCEEKYFHAEVDRSKKPFTTVMPPPNITGKLHMGHALDNTLQDILIRRAGYESKARELVSGSINVLEIRECRKAIDVLKSKQRSQMMNVHAAERDVELARKQLNEAMVERKTHEKLKEKAFEEFKQELLHEESKEIDELVSYTYHDNGQRS